jgi:hypothetical protein
VGNFQNPRCQIDPEELRRSGLGESFKKAPRGTSNVENPKRLLAQV